MKSPSCKYTVFFLLLILLAIGTSCGSDDKVSKGDGSIEDEDETFKLLDGVNDIVVLNGTYTQKYEADEASNRGFDARNAEFITDTPMWGTIDINSGSSITGMVWAGGYARSTKPWNASWLDHKATDQPNLPGRNSAAIENWSFNTTITGMYTRNVHDAFRSTSAENWRVQHCWSSYTRDDSIENDKFLTGSVYDCLFDGTYVGFSSRPDDNSLTANGNVMSIDKVLIRLQAMPYPFKWTEKPGIINENNEPYTGVGVPYGHGSLFKITNDNSKDMHYSIKNSVFVGANNVNDEKFDFPDASLIDECSDITIIWLGSGSYPGYLPTNKFPNAFTILTGQEGRDFWIQKVTDWHERHPEVGANHKPTSPGVIVFPEIF